MRTSSIMRAIPLAFCAYLACKPVFGGPIFDDEFTQLEALKDFGIIFGVCLLASCLLPFVLVNLVSNRRLLGVAFHLVQCRKPSAFHLPWWRHVRTNFRRKAFKLRSAHKSKKSIDEKGQDIPALASEQIPQQIMLGRDTEITPVNSRSGPEHPSI